jgi:hypothetical protein
MKAKLSRFNSSFSLTCLAYLGKSSKASMLTNVTLVSVLHPHESVFLSLSQMTGLPHKPQFHFRLYNGMLFNPHKLVIRNSMVLFRGNKPFASHAFLGAVFLDVSVTPNAITVLDAIVSTIHTTRHTLFSTPFCNFG